MSYSTATVGSVCDGTGTDADLQSASSINTKKSTLSTLTFGAHVRPTEVKLKDYRYSNPGELLSAKTKSQKSLRLYSVYDSYGCYQDESVSRQFSKYCLEARQAESETDEAVSNCVELMPGKFIEIIDLFKDNYQHE